MAITDSQTPAELRGRVTFLCKGIVANLSTLADLGASLRELRDSQTVSGRFLDGDDFPHYCSDQLLLDLDTVDEIIRLAETVDRAQKRWRRDIRSRLG